MSEESGWKLVHGDVFRPPHNLFVLSAVVGTGSQLALLVLLVIVVAIVGMLYIGYVEYELKAFSQHVRVQQYIIVVVCLIANNCYFVY